MATSELNSPSPRPAWCMTPRMAALGAPDVGCAAVRLHSQQRVEVEGLAPGTQLVGALGVRAPYSAGGAPFSTMPAAPSVPALSVNVRHSGTIYGTVRNQIAWGGLVAWASQAGTWNNQSY